ncbi:phosphoribosyltransferase [Spirillospora albida]|uniref:phosphoribosyltransferase n=1 Tax=Spirillospora albida TaxID=58123 RepID=UPI000AFEE384|nr:phosphoribosyltransferase family protein [Spirillospora albida]
MPWNRPAEGGQGNGEPVRLPYADRAEAGRVLAERLVPLFARDADVRDAIVLALPRGGVPVGHEIARRLGAPLDVLVTRKIGYPPQPELGVGAIAEGGEPVFDRDLLDQLGLTEDDLADTVAAERAELERRVWAYRAGRPLADPAGRPVIVVDDGLATGGTARAALRALRERGPSRLVLAVPVGAAETVRAMDAEADEVVVPAAPWEFRAVGQWYRDFDQLTDRDVLTWLERAAEPAVGGPGPGR